MPSFQERRESLRRVKLEATRIEGAAISVQQARDRETKQRNEANFQAALEKANELMIADPRYKSLIIALTNSEIVQDVFSEVWRLWNTKPTEGYPKVWLFLPEVTKHDLLHRHRIVEEKRIVGGERMYSKSGYTGTRGGKEETVQVVKEFELDRAIRDLQANGFIFTDSELLGSVDEAFMCGGGVTLVGPSQLFDQSGWDSTGEGGGGYHERKALVPQQFSVFANCSSKEEISYRLGTPNNKYVKPYINLEEKGYNNLDDFLNHIATLANIAEEHSDQSIIGSGFCPMDSYVEALGRGNIKSLSLHI